jgi:hypothetical protein
MAIYPLESTHKDGSGTLSRREITALLRNKESRLRSALDWICGDHAPEGVFEEDGLAEELYELYDEKGIDADYDGEVDFDEFHAHITRWAPAWRIYSPPSGSTE